MTAEDACSAGSTVLVAESDVIVRIAIAEYLRACGYRVIEAADGLEAKTVFQRGPDVHVLFADARLADAEGGFALAQWTRRYRPSVSVVLVASLVGKAEAAAHLCSRKQTSPPPASHLQDRIRAMKAKPASGANRRTPKARAG